MAIGVTVMTVVSAPLSVDAEVPPWLTGTEALPLVPELLPDPLCVPDPVPVPLLLVPVVPDDPVELDEPPVDDDDPPLRSLPVPQGTALPSGWVRLGAATCELTCRGAEVSCVAGYRKRLSQLST